MGRKVIKGVEFSSTLIFRFIACLLYLDVSTIQALMWAVIRERAALVSFELKITIIRFSCVNKCTLIFCQFYARLCFLSQIKFLEIDIFCFILRSCLRDYSFL